MKNKLKVRKTVVSMPAIAIVLIGIGCISFITAVIVSINLSREYRQRPPMRARQSDVSSIREWMTLRYISRTYGTPESVIEMELGITSGTYSRASVTKIAKETDMEAESIIKIIQRVVQTFQQLHPTPPV